MKINDPMYVEWVDSFDPYPNDTWISKDTVNSSPNDEQIIISSIGYLVRETKHYLILASHKYQNTVGHTLAIPKDAIRKKKKLTIKF